MGKCLFCSFRTLDLFRISDFPYADVSDFPYSVRPFPKFPPPDYNAWLAPCGERDFAPAMETIQNAAEVVMSENEAGVAEQGTDVEQEQEFPYPITVVDVGPAAKKVTVEIPHDRIVSKLDEQYKELRQQAAIPGFRIGHAPRKLIEKRFSESVKEQVASALIRESYEQAVKKNDLKIIGEPEFDSQEQIKLPEGDGPLAYSFSVKKFSRTSPFLNLPT